MKKLCTLLILAFAASFLFIACDGGSDDTALKWTRSDGDSATMSSIKWVSEGSTDQEWTGSYSDGDSTDSKTVSKTTGNGEGLGDDGTPYTLYIGQSQSVTLSEGTDNSLTITGIQTK